jgi:RnfABCDGE-type electron transport complex B subunit
MLVEPSITIAIAAMGGLGFLFAAFLAIADKKLRVVEDPLVAKLLEALPNTNCGACGVAGCGQLAELIATGKLPVNACTAGGQEVTDILAEFMGVESVKAERIIAVLLCRGGDIEAKKNAVYRGERTCAAANTTGGEKACLYGCHGFGDCVVSCDFGAMDMDDNGLPAIFYDKCVGCGACAKACPRDLIELHPEDRTLFVYCKNLEKGAVAKKACSVACIACTLCVKDCEVDGGIVMKDNLAEIDYELCPQDDVPTPRCPTKCILDGEEESMTRENFYSKRVKDAS